MYITDYTGTRLLFLLYFVIISSTAPSRLRLTLLTRAGGACAQALRHQRPCTLPHTSTASWHPWSWVQNLPRDSDEVNLITAFSPGRDQGHLIWFFGNGADSPFVSQRAHLGRVLRRGQPAPPSHPAGPSRQALLSSDWALLSSDWALFSTGAGGVPARLRRAARGVRPPPCFTVRYKNLKGRGSADRIPLDLESRVVFGKITWCLARLFVSLFPWVSYFRW